MDGHSDDPPYISRKILQWISAEYHGVYFRDIIIDQENMKYCTRLGLNGNHYDILESSPSPVEFSQICHISRPVLIKGELALTMA